MFMMVMLLLFLLLINFMMMMKMMILMVVMMIMMMFCVCVSEFHVVVFSCFLSMFRGRRFGVPLEATIPFPRYQGSQ